MRCSFPQTCIYYYEVYDKHNKPSVRIVCDYKDGTEIKKLSTEEITNCPHFKTYKQVKETHKKYFKSLLDRIPK